MASCLPDDREGAVREVAQVYELIKIHQPLLFLQYSSQPPSTTTQLAQSLLSEALRALSVALSVMKQQQPGPATPSVKSEPQLSSPSPVAADPDAITTTARRGKRRRSVILSRKNSWVNLTTVPYEDGYEWRKYGEKKINGTHFTRSYFRCTYKDDTGCQATKHIQQKDNSDPPVFEVTYNNDHTCNCTRTTATAKKNSSSSSSNNLAFLGHSMIKQESPVLPPLVEASAIIPLDQPPCQEPFPISSQQFYGTVSEYHAAGIPSTTSTNSSCISGVSCDDYYSGDMGQMTMEPAGDNDPLHDLELFLMCDSFTYY
ncbi:probable WRKY transcription factor 62 [Phragmites australis]|uniref:probable WRKY transcription factor 62 n=1 Tax=Phragmites australis TaxID=29695 RepID=UPI002D777F01|nr:probable WRKY transcription factor 62 [Phragmites australis]